MYSKIFEIRDKATRIDVIANKLKAMTDVEKHYLTRNGYGQEFPLILVTKLDGAETHYDSYQWNNDTMRVAHRYISENFDDIPNGWVVDVETIKGDREWMKIPERFDHQDWIRFKVKEGYLSDEVENILDKVYGWNTEPVHEPDEDFSSMIDIKVDDLKSIGTKIYDFINEYVDMIQYV